MLIPKSFHSLQSLSVSYFRVVLGLPAPGFPPTCMSEAVLTLPLEHSTCLFQRSLQSFRMRSRSSMPSHASSSLDLVVTESCRLTLQICLIIVLSFRCRRSSIHASAYLQWLCHSGERAVAHGPLVPGLSALGTLVDLHPLLAVL